MTLYKNFVFFGTGVHLARSQTRKNKIYLRINIAPDQAIILGVQIFLDYRSLSSIGQKYWRYWIPPLFLYLSSLLKVVWMFSESYSSSFCLLIFLPLCLFVFSFFCTDLSLIIHLSSYLFILVYWKLPEQTQLAIREPVKTF